MANDAGPSGAEKRNRGIPFHPDWISETRVDAHAIEQAAESLAARIEVGKHSPPSLLQTITVMDLTTLADDDTDERVRRLCAKGRQPLPPELLARFGRQDHTLRVAAVCIYHPFIHTALGELQGTGIKVATVSADFPKGLAPMEERIAQIHRSVRAGADEIDVVIRRDHVLQGRWQALYDEVAAFRTACGNRLMKVILGTGELQTLDNIARASLVAMMAGADFIKTSTGKEAVNATRSAALVMTRAIREYQRRTGTAVGFKPAGGIRTAKQALEYWSLVKEELGGQWLGPVLLRIGASSVLDDIERHLRQLAS
ncbi:MAG: deoxyribose-phosphate aldolase [Candidatus Acidiferrales bacterium]|jgi:deoxyribose-phosphate aldolase